MRHLNFRNPTSQHAPDLTTNDADFRIGWGEYFKLIISLFIAIFLIFLASDIDGFWNIINRYSITRWLSGLFRTPEGKAVALLLSLVSVLFGFAYAFLGRFRSMALVLSKRIRESTEQLQDPILCSHVMKGRAFDVFSRLTRVGPTFAIEDAIERCWRLHDWGRIPLFTDVKFRITIDNRQNVVAQSVREKGLDGSPIAYWRWLKVNYCMEHKLDLQLRDPPIISKAGLPNGQGIDFFEISGQTPQALVRQIVTPLAVMAFEDYAIHRDIWDGGPVTVAYPLTKALREKIVRDPTDKTEMKFARSLRWVTGLSDSAIDKFKDTEDIVKRFLEDRKNGPCVIIKRKEALGAFKCVAISFESIFDSNGEIRWDLWSRAKKEYSFNTQICRWVEKPPSRNSQALVGFYVPIFKDDLTDISVKDWDEIPICELTREGLGEAEFFHCWSYLNVEEAVSQGESIYRQNSYDFAVGWTSTFQNAEIYLEGDIEFVSDPAVVLYSLHAYAPSEAGKSDKQYRMEIMGSSGDRSAVTFYPSDTISIRWSQKEDERASDNLVATTQAADFAATAHDRVVKQMSR